MTSFTIRGQGALLGVSGRPDGPVGGLSSLGGSAELVQGQGLAVFSEGVLLQLDDGHGGEGARQALVHVLLTCGRESGSTRIRSQQLD